MKGYVYSNSDGGLGFRSEEFILSNPDYFVNNHHLIGEVWRFNTEDVARMRDLFTYFSNRKIVAQSVYEFCQQVGFDLTGLIAQIQSERQPLFENPSK